MSFQSEVEQAISDAIGRGLLMGKGVVTRVDSSGEFETITVAGRTMNHGVENVDEGDTVMFLIDGASAVALVKLQPGTG